MACVPMSKYALIDQQLLVMQEKDKDAPKDKRYTYEIDDEEAVLTFDDRFRNAMIKHYPRC